MPETQTFESVLNAANLPVLEEYYRIYKKDSSGLPRSWQMFFQKLDEAGINIFEPDLDGETPITATTDLHMRVIGLMQSFRRHGHFSAQNDPLDPEGTNKDRLLTANEKFTTEELDQHVNTFFAGQKTSLPIREIILKMKKTYCGSIGTEFYYIREDERRRWLIENLESKNHLAKLNKNIRKMIFEKLYNAESFEKILATRYPGKKRFSLEGAESLIPTLASIVENAGTYNIDQIVIGMAHRGRLNVLTNILGKDPSAIFAEFDEKTRTEEKAGDVKYHMGFSSDVASLTGGVVHLSLGFNPSHLEVINPVILGSTRARQTNSNDVLRTRNFPVIIHGDAAFAGQGINYECLNMADLDGYTVGGTLHIIVNNQIGFTTDPKDSRSTSYCTDLAKMLQAPIFHVNGNDPEACYKAIQLCLKWRQEFKTDVFLDLICYRRWGHNETDEPTFTQPLMYKKIKAMPTTPKMYEQQLLSNGFTEKEIDDIKQKRNQELNDAYEKLQIENLTIERESLKAQWKGFKKDSLIDPDTSVSLKILKEIGHKLGNIPQDFNAHPKIKRLFEIRLSMFSDQPAPLDWGMAELLAYGSILDNGNHIRLTGQDAQRGTFSHRHATIIDEQTGQPYSALQHINPKARIEIINSLLSEMGALGFEFGYSLADPRTLVIWEAQFGDFVNNAQVIIDQFITSCEAKWHRMSGLVMLLPHGYEGQGPEHSSARLERFLQLCSQDNIQVCVPTTPAQFFHLLRRQVLRDVRKPLVIMSPKSLLRHPAASSSLDELAIGQFSKVLDDPSTDLLPQKVKRIILCSGKVYYDLIAHRQSIQQFEIAITRVEMLYPYPEKEIDKLLQKYNNAQTICWVQDEPRNQGAWTYMELRILRQLASSQTLYYIGREPSPSSATGYFKIHKQEQEQIIREAFGSEKKLKNKIKFN